jgi:hypothetical protein
MKNIMKLGTGWQLQPDCNLVDELCDAIRTEKLLLKLALGRL